MPDSEADSRVPPTPARERDTAELICQLCRQFYGLGWVSGTGGGISIRDARGVWMAPSGVQKERLDPADVFLLEDGAWARPRVVEPPADETLKLSECQPLFYSAFRLRGAGAVIHSHSLWAVLAASLARAAGHQEFRSRDLEMQKGLRAHGNFDELRVPIIPNTAHEAELSASLEAAMLAYPQVDAVIVEGHGIYVWGRDWVQAKTQAECLDYLMRYAVEAQRAGLS